MSFRSARIFSNLPEQFPSGGGGLLRLLLLLHKRGDLFLARPSAGYSHCYVSGIFVGLILGILEGIVFKTLSKRNRIFEVSGDYNALQFYLLKLLNFSANLTKFR